MHGKKYLVFISVILFLSLSIYANTLTNGFVYDDSTTIVSNLFIKKLSNLPLLFNQNDYFSLSKEITYRPFVTVTYFMDYALFGLNPRGYHLTNIILHTINGVLLYVFIAHLASSLPQQEDSVYPPFIISLVFVCHPILTEAVNAISFREDTLVFFFYMTTLIIYLSLRIKLITTRRAIQLLLYIISCLLYFLALLSKEVAITLPLIIASYEWIYYSRKDKPAYSIIFNTYNFGYIAITCIYLYLRFFHFYNIEEGYLRPWPLIERLQTTPWLLLNYLKVLLFPVGLSADYVVYPVKSLFSSNFTLPAAFFVIFLITIFALIRLNRDIAFGMLFFLITLIPVYNIVPLGHPFAERYLYLPSVGFSIVAGRLFTLLFYHASTFKKHLLMLFLAILSIYSLTVVRRNPVWKDNYSLWLDTVKKMPDSSLAQSEVGLLYFEQGRFGEAVSQIQNAIKLNPKDPIYHYNLGLMYARQRKFKEAIKAYQTALRLKPDYYEARMNLAITIAQNQ